MDTKTIFAGAIVLLAIAGLSAWGRFNQAGVPGKQSGDASVLTASESLYDFGTISMKDGNVSHTFTVANASAEDIIVSELTTSCMCTNVYIVGENGIKRGPFGMPGHAAVPKANETIQAGTARNIEVVYNPNAHGPAGVGMIDRFVYLTDSEGGTLELEIKANVTP